MKPTSVLSWALFTHTAVGFGLTGGVERATFLSIYYAEEVFTDPSQWSIAAGCKGTRKGLRGQPNRCNILEFVDYMWTRTEGVVLTPDKKPIPDPANGGKPTRAFDERPTFATMEKLLSKKVVVPGDTNMFNSAQQILQLFEKPPGNSVLRCYTNQFDPGKVLNGYTTYVDVIGDAGTRLGPAREAINALPDGSKEKKKLAKWITEAQLGANLAYEQRVGTAAEYMLKGGYAQDPPVKSLSDKFGHPIETRNHDFPADFYDDKGKLKFSLKAYQEPDREATINKYADEFGGKDKAAEAYDKAVKEFNAQDSGDHMKAIEAASKNKAGAMGCGT